MPLSEYRRKRRSSVGSGKNGPRFVIQHHAARSDHYDFRLEIEGVLVSWAIPKGPSTNPGDRRMARRTEDHPLDYAGFEGVIPEGEYGAGAVTRGHLSFRLQGEKLHGVFALTRIREGKDETWLLVKRRDEDADARRKPVKSQPESVLSGRKLDDLDESS